MCLICDGSKDGVDDPFGAKPNEFQTTMCNACCENPCCCLYGFACTPCAACTLRRKVIEYDMTRYECCQGYIPACCCFCPGKCGEKTCPTLCLCCESICCPSLSISSSRMYVQDALSLSSDPCDRRLIRCSNCLQLLSCVCWILAIFCEEFRSLAYIIDCIADCVTYSVLGCMVAQVEVELKHHYETTGQPLAPPTAQTMVPRSYQKR